MPTKKPKVSPGERAIGADGWPITLRSEQSVDQVRADVLARTLMRCERAWKDGSALALAEAVRVCHHRDAPLPEWVARGVLAVLNMVFTGTLRQRGRRGRLSNPETAHRQWMKHYTRWDMVTELRERQPELSDIATSLEQCYGAVSERLDGTEAAGTAETIKRSYQRVERAMKTGRVGPLFSPGS